jgi:hypothetical protein
MPAAVATMPPEQKPADLKKLREQFNEFATSKTDEIDESRTAWRYYHGSHYTQEQIATLKKRNQPALVFNMIDRITDGTVGVIMRARGAPKAFPRTQASAQGAEIATQCLRYALDAGDWKDKEGECIRAAYITGLSVSQIDEIQGDHGDPDYEINETDPTTFFRDPRATNKDLADARFMGVSKWMTPDDIEEMFPGKGEVIASVLNDGGAETTAYDQDKEIQWTQAKKRVRLVEHWWREAGEWRYCFYAGNTELTSGTSPFVDEKGKTICRFFPLVNRFDQDGDAYGYVRHLRGPQDAINQHRSKAVWIMNTRQIIINRRNMVEGQDLDVLRAEAARPDGVLEYDGERGDLEVSQPAQEFLQQTQYYQDAKAMIEGFGPSQAALAQGENASSGRALQMLMQAGMAQLGPFLSNIRSWRMRMYRALWAQQQRNWTSERMIRVTDDEDVAQFLQINGMQVDEYGFPAIVNALGAIDVDIILEEGPDSVNVMSDVFDIISSLTQSTKDPRMVPMLIEVSQLPASDKKKLLKMWEQPPSPAQQQAEQTELADKVAGVKQKEADAVHKLAQAGHIGAMAEHTAAKAAVEVASHGLDAERHTVELGQSLGALPQAPPPQAPQPAGY